MLLQSIRPSDTELLFDACLAGNQRAVIDLLLEGLSVDTPNRHEQTLLMIASQKGDLAMVSFLLGQGADVVAQDVYGRTCLHHAICSGCSQLIRYLVSAGAAVDSSTHGGHTQLHFACRSTELAVMRTLVEIGADVHALTLRSESTLHQAVHAIEHGGCIHRMPKAVEYLSSVGVDRNVRNIDGKNAVDVVERYLQVFAEDKQRVLVLENARLPLSAADNHCHGGLGL